MDSSADSLLAGKYQVLLSEFSKLKGQVVLVSKTLAEEQRTSEELRRRLQETQRQLQESQAKTTVLSRPLQEVHPSPEDSYSLEDESRHLSRLILEDSPSSSSDHPRSAGATLLPSKANRQQEKASVLLPARDCELLCSKGEAELRDPLVLCSNGDKVPSVDR